MLMPIFIVMLVEKRFLIRCAVIGLLWRVIFTAREKTGNAVADCLRHVGVQPLIVVFIV